MTRELRDLHRRAFRILRIALPVCLFIGLLGYRFPVRSSFPAALLDTLPEDARSEHDQEFEFGRFRFRLELLHSPSATAPGTEERWVRITSLEPLRQPDIHVYWSARVASFEEPPIGANLLGILDPRAPGAFRLPASASFVRGHLVLFSVGQNVLIAQTQLPQPF